MASKNLQCDNLDCTNRIPKGSVEGKDYFSTHIDNHEYFIECKECRKVKEDFNKFNVE